MNSKIAITAFLIIAASLTGYYFYSNQNRVKNAPLSQSQVTNNNSSVALTYPVSLDKIGVRSITVVYDFFGKVVRLEKLGENTKIILDTSDEQTPEFITGSYTVFFKTS